MAEHDITPEDIQRELERLRAAGRPEFDSLLEDAPGPDYDPKEEPEERDV